LLVGVLAPGGASRCSVLFCETDLCRPQQDTRAPRGARRVRSNNTAERGYARDQKNNFLATISQRKKQKQKTHTHTPAKVALPLLLFNTNEAVLRQSPQLRSPLFMPHVFAQFSGLLAHHQDFLLVGARQRGGG